MARSRLYRALRKAEDDNGESMDVLLQLTLPIVLILAFLVLTEVSLLQRELNEMTEDLKGTATGELRESLDIVVLELQLQLLLEATETVVKKERSAIGVDDYGSSPPSAKGLLDGRMEDPPRGICSKLSESLGDKGLAATKRRLAKAIKERYRSRLEELLEQHPKLNNRERQLREISEENKAKFIDHLKGLLEGIRDTSVRTELSFIYSLLNDPEFLARSPDKGDLWRSAQETEGQSGAELMKAFTNARIDHLLELFGNSGCPLLDKTRMKVRPK